jgi:hypothetical protein
MTRYGGRMAPGRLDIVAPDLPRSFAPISAILHVSLMAALSFFRAAHNIS